MFGSSKLKHRNKGRWLQVFCSMIYDHVLAGKSVWLGKSIPFFFSANHIAHLPSFLCFRMASQCMLFSRDIVFVTLFIKLKFLSHYWFWVLLCLVNLNKCKSYLSKINMIHYEGCCVLGCVAMLCGRNLLMFLRQQDWKCWYSTTRLHSLILHMTAIFIVGAMRTWNLT
jgi:hypothetical protein